MNKTNIGYLDFTWNPLVMRCTKVSPACDNCWHLRMARRLASNSMIIPEIQAAYAGEIGPMLIESRLDEPLRRKKSAVIGVQFMGDLFHKDVPDDFIFDVLTIVAKCPQHAFQILTKRPGRMRHLWRNINSAFVNHAYPNLWLGVTVENQETADERIPLLLQTPAAVRFVSAEPLLGKVDLWPWLPINSGHDELSDKPPQWEREYGRPDLENLLSLVITGGETGPGARPTHPDDFRLLRDQCVATGVSFFFKSWGNFVPAEPGELAYTTFDFDYSQPGLPEPMTKYKKSMDARDHLLDGKVWRQMPEVTK